MQLCNFEATSNKILTEHIRKKHTVNDQTVFSCRKCRYETIMENNLIEHMKNKHSQDEIPKRESQENIPCIYWNHGYCSKADRCRFAHVEIPACHLQENCRKYQCPLYHNNKTLNTFLGRGQVRRPLRKQ